MLTHSPRDRSRSPHSTNGPSNSSSIKQHHSNHDDTSNQIDLSNNSKSKKESESQQRMRSLKTFIQTLVNESTPIGSTYDEQVKACENACMEEYRDLSSDRIRRMIRSVFKLRKSHQSSSIHSHPTTPFLHQDHTNTNDRFNCIDNNNKKSRPNSSSNNTTTKTSDLVTSPVSTLSALDADFLRHAFSQPFGPSLNLSAYLSAAAVSNGAGPVSPLFSSNFSPSNFLQSLTNTTPLAPPPSLSHTHTNGINDSSKQVKLSNTETSSIKVLVNAYREAASYLCRSADELEQLI